MDSIYECLGIRKMFKKKSEHPHIQNLKIDKRPPTIQEAWDRAVYLDSLNEYVNETFYSFLTKK